MALEGGNDNESLSKRKTLEGVLRDLRQIRPNEYKEYKVREWQGGVSILIGENSIVDEHLLKDRYEIFPRVNGQSIQELFGDYPDQVCRYLTLEQVIRIAEVAEAAKKDAAKLPVLKKTIDDCYPEGFAESIVAMFSHAASADEYTQPEKIRDRIRRQYERYIEDPKRKMEEE